VPPIQIGIVGLGKIARDQHLPAIAASDAFHLAATVDPRAPGLYGVPHFSDLPALFAERLELDAIALCTPPQMRYDLALAALAHKLHLLLEKPACTTLAAAEILRSRAEAQGTTLFAAWHSRFAPGVEPARDWLAPCRIASGVATWHEDVRIWHPRQDWIWQPGGFGVFDAGINAISILTRILPSPIRLKRATLLTPVNAATPIAAKLEFRDETGAAIVLDLDWTKAGEPCWDIDIETNRGRLKLEAGGAVLSLPTSGPYSERTEYPNLYGHFAQLIAAGASDFDLVPLLHVSDAFLIGDRQAVAEFND